MYIKCIHIYMCVRSTFNALSMLYMHVQYRCLVCYMYAICLCTVKAAFLPITSD